MAGEPGYRRTDINKVWIARELYGTPSLPQGVLSRLRHRHPAGQHADQPHPALARPLGAAYSPSHRAWIVVPIMSIIPFRRRLWGFRRIFFCTCASAANFPNGIHDFCTALENYSTPTRELYILLGKTAKIIATFYIWTTIMIKFRNSESKSCQHWQMLQRWRDQVSMIHVH